MNKFYVTFLLTIITTCSLQGQVVSLGFGPNYLVDKERVSIHPDIKGKPLGNDDYPRQIKYEQYLKNNFTGYIGFSRYPIATSFHFYKENAGGSFGWRGTIVHLFDLGVSYNIFSKSKFILQPNFGIGIQKAIPRGIGCICSDISNGIRPDNFELLKEIEAYSYSNTQLVPKFGIKFGYAFWGRLELFMDVYQVIGHQPIQELRMDYSYRGVAQPTAISYSDGTGRFWMLGLGYRFVKSKKG